MVIYHDVDIEGIDTFCSVLGNELLFESNNYFNVIIPSLNVGFYECIVNKSKITFAIEQCYILFKNVQYFSGVFALYSGLHANVDLIELTGNRLKFETSIEATFSDRKSLSIEGQCLRFNSYSYGTFNFLAQNMNILVEDKYNSLIEYLKVPNFRNDQICQDFLLCKDLSMSKIKEIHSLINHST